MIAYRHRNAWVQERLERPADNFGADVTGFAVMSNHLHVIPGKGPGAVARRYEGERHGVRSVQEDHGSQAGPRGNELRMLTAVPAVVAERPVRLASLPWCMRASMSMDGSLTQLDGTGRRVRGASSEFSRWASRQRVATDPRPAEDGWRRLARQRAAFRPLVPLRSLVAPRTCNPPPLAPASVGSAASAPAATRFPNSSRVSSARFAPIHPSRRA